MTTAEYTVTVRVEAEPSASPSPEWLREMLTAAIAAYPPEQRDAAVAAAFRAAELDPTGDRARQVLADIEHIRREPHADRDREPGSSHTRLRRGAGSPQSQLADAFFAADASAALASTAFHCPACGRVRDGGTSVTIDAPGPRQCTETVADKLLAILDASVRLRPNGAIDPRDADAIDARLPPDIRVDRDAPIIDGYLRFRNDYASSTPSDKSHST